MSAPPDTQAFRRVQDYAAIFINAGERWRFCVPIDGRVDGDVVTIQGIRMERAATGGGWRLETEDGHAFVVRAKASDS